VTAEVALQAQSELGEGPLWDVRKRLLYWVDISGHKVHVFDPSSGADRFVDVGQPVGCVAPRKNGDLVLAMQDGFAILDVESGEVRNLIDPEKHLPDNRFNDGKCDPRGRFWAGTMSMKRVKAAGSLYCLYPDLTVRTMLTRVTTSNGLAWSSDERKLYYIDTGTPYVSVFNYDPESGEISRRRRIITIPQNQGKPDGMTIDEEGMLWVAHWGGGRVSRWDPKDGSQTDVVEVPAPNVTSCAFGAPMLDTLYITTARGPLNDEERKEYPLAGGLFQVKPGVRGRPEPAFAG
jgi:sugar lactone lactonase YvrE